MFGTVDSAGGGERDDVNEPVTSDRESPVETAHRVRRNDSETDCDEFRATAERLRNRAERIRRQQLDTAIGRLEAHGNVSPEVRRTVARLSTRITDAIVEEWVSELADDGVDTTTAAELLVEE